MRQGFSLIELLIVVAILAALVGVAVPFFQSYLRDARTARFEQDVAMVKRAITRYMHDERLNAPMVSGAAGMPPALFSPDKYFGVRNLVPRHLDKVPLDPWDNEMYRFGFRLASLGERAIPVPEAVVSRPLFQAPATRNPGDGTVLLSPERNEANYHARLIAEMAVRYRDEFGDFPAEVQTLWDTYGTVPPLDPWGRPYEVRFTSGMEVRSHAADLTNVADDVIVRDPSVEDEASWADVCAFPVSGLLAPPARRGSSPVYPAATSGLFSGVMPYVTFRVEPGYTEGPRSLYWARVVPAPLFRAPKEEWEFQFWAYVTPDAGVARVGVFAFHTLPEDGWKLALTLVRGQPVRTEIRGHATRRGGELLAPPVLSPSPLPTGALQQFRISLRGTSTGGSHQLIQGGGNYGRETFTTEPLTPRYFGFFLEGSADADVLLQPFRSHFEVF